MLPSQRARQAHSAVSSATVTLSNLAGALGGNRTNLRLVAFSPAQRRGDIIACAVLAGALHLAVVLVAPYWPHSEAEEQPAELPVELVSLPMPQPAPDPPTPEPAAAPTEPPIAQAPASEPPAEPDAASALDQPAAAPAEPPAPDPPLPEIIPPQPAAALQEPAELPLAAPAPAPPVVTAHVAPRHSPRPAPPHISAKPVQAAVRPVTMQTFNDQGAPPAPAPAPAATAAAAASFEARLLAAVQAEARRNYPASARMMGVTGQAVVSFDYRDGAVHVTGLVQTSGSPSLDHAAMDAVQHADYPQPPPALSGQTLSKRVHVRFELTPD